LHNRYRHPRPEVLEELHSAHVQTESTDVSGAACFHLDGRSGVQRMPCGTGR
jgi:beta-lactamase superfamily II metal-dependent hydrolase